jgi:hypothetical protein
LPPRTVSRSRFRIALSPLSECGGSTTHPHADARPRSGALASRLRHAPVSWSWMSPNSSSHCSLPTWDTPNVLCTDGCLTSTESLCDRIALGHFAGISLIGQLAFWTDQDFAILLAIARLLQIVRRLVRARPYTSSTRRTSKPPSTASISMRLVTLHFPLT